MQALSPYSSKAMTSRPLYVPHTGQTLWGCLGLWHCGQELIVGLVRLSWARRWSRRALEVFLLGTAISDYLFRFTKDVG